MTKSMTSSDFVRVLNKYVREEKAKSFSLCDPAGEGVMFYGFKEGSELRHKQVYDILKPVLNKSENISVEIVIAIKEASDFYGSFFMNKNAKDLKVNFDKNRGIDRRVNFRVIQNQ